jgi:hypothetical protein
MKNNSLITDQNQLFLQFCKEHQRRQNHMMFRKIFGLIAFINMLLIYIIY